MAAPWRLEGGLSFPVGRTIEAQQAKATGNQISEGISVRQHDLLLRHRLHHAHRALAGTSVLALVLVSLALTYLMVTCMRHLSKAFAISSQHPRHLASNFPDEDEEACQAPLGDEEEETEAGNADESGPDGAAAAPGEQLSAHGPAPAVQAGQTRRVLAPQIQERVGRTLLLLEQPVAALTPLIPNLRPDHCLGTVRTLCRIAVLELSAFATVPARLQPLRQRVAQAYMDLIERVLTTEPTAGEAVRHDWSTSLRLMQFLLQKIAQTPLETEKLPVKRYAEMMANQRRTCHWMLTQVLHVLQAIKDIKTQDSSARSHEAVFQRRLTLNALFIARRRQILRSVTLRYWLEFHHRSFSIHLVYDSESFKQAVQSPLDTLPDKLKKITRAATEAGGRPATDYAPLPSLTPEQLQMLQYQPLLQPFGHQQQPDPPHPHPPQAHGPAPIGPIAPPPAQHAHPPAQPSPQAPIMPQPPQAAQGAAHAPMAFDPAAQDLQFPAIHPDPQIAGQEQPPIPVPPIHLPPIYQYSYVSPLSLDEPSTPSSADALSGMELGASSAPSQPSGIPGQLQTPHASSQQTHTGTNQDSSSDDDDA
ncbi:hypothetical protein Emed_003986 [Eimeria media]